MITLNAEGSYRGGMISHASEVSFVSIGHSFNHEFRDRIDQSLGMELARFRNFCYHLRQWFLGMSFSFSYLSCLLYCE